MIDILDLKQFGFEAIIAMHMEAIKILNFNWSKDDSEYVYDGYEDGYILLRYVGKEKLSDCPVCENHFHPEYNRLRISADGQIFLKCSYDLENVPYGGYDEHEYECVRAHEEKLIGVLKIFRPSSSDFPFRKIFAENIKYEEDKYYRQREEHARFWQRKIFSVPENLRTKDEIFDQDK